MPRIVPCNRRSRSRRVPPPPPSPIVSIGTLEDQLEHVQDLLNGVPRLEKQWNDKLNEQLNEREVEEVEFQQQQLQHFKQQVQQRQQRIQQRIQQQQQDVIANDAPVSASVSSSTSASTFDSPLAECSHTHPFNTDEDKSRDGDEQGSEHSSGDKLVKDKESTCEIEKQIIGDEEVTTIKTTTVTRYTNTRTVVKRKKIVSLSNIPPAMAHRLDRRNRSEDRSFSNLVSANRAN